MAKRKAWPFMRSVIASFVGIIFVIIHEINSTKNDVIMNMPFIKCLRKRKGKFYICGFIAATERGNEHFIIGFIGVLDIFKSLF